MNSALALSALGCEARDAVAALLDAMKRRENFVVVPPFAHSVRQQSCRALGKIGPDAHAAIPALVEALHDGVPGVRYNAVYALGRIGPNARPTLPKLRLCLKDEDPDVRDMAAESISLLSEDDRVSP